MLYGRFADEKRALGNTKTCNYQLSPSHQTSPCHRSSTAPQAKRGKNDVGAVLQHGTTSKNGPKCVWSRAGMPREMPGKKPGKTEKLRIQPAVYGDGFTVDVCGVCRGQESH